MYPSTLCPLVYHRERIVMIAPFFSFSLYFHHNSMFGIVKDVESRDLFHFKDNFQDDFNFICIDKFIRIPISKRVFSMFLGVLTIFSNSVFSTLCFPFNYWSNCFQASPSSLLKGVLSICISVDLYSTSIYLETCFESCSEFCHEFYFEFFFALCSSWEIGWEILNTSKGMFCSPFSLYSLNSTRFFGLSFNVACWK